MARRPRRVQAQPAEVHLAEEGRTLRERLRFVVRRGMARGGPAVHALLRPLRPLCRAMALGGGHLLRPLSVLLALVRRHLQSLIPRRALALGRRLFLARVGRQATVYGAGDGEPRTPPKPRAQGSAIFYDRRGADDRRRPRPPSPQRPAPLPQQQPTAPPPVVVDGVDVPRHIVNLFVDYCRRTCPANSTVCHFCIFEMQRSQNFIVATWKMPAHCQDLHRLEGGSVRCPWLAAVFEYVQDVIWHCTAVLCTIFLQGGGISTFDVQQKELMEETSGFQRHLGVQMMEIK